MTDGGKSLDGRDLAQRAAIVAGTLVVAVVVFKLRFCGAVDMPSRPAAPSVQEIAGDQAAAALGGSDVYARQIAADAATAHLPRAPGVDEMSRAFPDHVDQARHRLEAGQSFDAAGLRVSAVEVEGMLSLAIENLGSRPVAYRVDARAERGRACRVRHRMPYDALALREQGDKGATAVRSMCGRHKGSGVVVTRVETIELPLLAYHYVSRMTPAALGLDAEELADHRSRSELPRCEILMPAWLESDLSGGRTHWRDLVDFYGRHPCDKYQFPKGYEAQDEGSRALPAPGAGG